jgi:hypothetical protein
MKPIDMYITLQTTNHGSQYINFRFCTFLLSLIILFKCFSSFGQSQIYNTNDTFIVPYGVTSITIRAWGAGGGGSKGFANQKGTGGGGGAFVKATVSVLPSENIAIVIGAGGLGATTLGGFGAAGSITSVTSGTNNITINGATGGTATFVNPTYDGDGGQGGTGTISWAGATSTSNYCGGWGANLTGGSGPVYTTPGGGGGGSASIGGNGRSAGSNSGFGNCTAGATQNGGTAIIDGGAGGDGGAVNGNGVAGFFPGGGGGGSAGTGTGANGASGKVEITWSCSAIPIASISGSQNICSVGTATVTGATATNGTIAWAEDGAGSITNGANTLSPTYTAATGDIGNMVTLTLTVTGSCEATSATYTVNVADGPIIENLSTNLKFCSLPDAIAAANSGETLYLPDGTYTGDVNIPFGLAITFTSDAPNGITIEGDIINAGTLINKTSITFGTGKKLTNAGLYAGNGSIVGSFLNNGIISPSIN